MFKRFYQFIGNYLNIADIFGYIMVSLIACTLWIGYQKSEKLAAHARIMAKLKAQSIEEKIEKAADSLIIEEKSTGIPDSKINKDNQKWDFLKYISLAKDSLKLVTLDKAKDTVGSINDSVNQTIKDVAGISDDPRATNTKKGTPKERPEIGQAETRDSLAPF